MVYTTSQTSQTSRTSKASKIKIQSAPNVDFLNSYIKSLVNNADYQNIPMNIDVVFDGGAFNGIIEQGIAMYLKTMEENGKIKVHRVSGCSIGAFIALVYVTNKFFDFEASFLRISKHLKEHHNLLECARTAKTYIFEQLTENDIYKLNDTLYITYYDMELSQQVTVSRFDSREQLYECIMRTSHIPFLSNKEFKYNERYVDGLTPHIFKDGKRNALFVSTLTRKKICRMMISSVETNCTSRLITGVADADDFFSRRSSDVCSWVNDWRFYHFYLFRVREFVLFFFVWTLNICVILINSLPRNVKHSLVYHGINKTAVEIYTDILLCLINN